MKGITVKEAAKELGCHPETVRRLNRRGILNAKRDYRNFRIFNLEEVLKIKGERETLNDCVDESTS